MRVWALLVCPLVPSLFGELLLCCGLLESPAIGAKTSGASVTVAFRNLLALALNYLAPVAFQKPGSLWMRSKAL